MKIKRKYVSLILKYIVIIALSAVIVLPFLWMVTTSLKPYSKIFVFPPQWIPIPPQWSNYTEMIAHSHIFLYMFNSLKVAVLRTGGVVFLACMSAYAFAKIRFPGRDIIFIIFLGALMIPIEVITVPLYLGFAKISMVDSHLAVIVPQMFGLAGVFGIFLMRQTFITVPNELMEAAKIDGCNHLRILWQIMVPIASSTIFALIIYTFFQAWNDYFTPFVFLSSTEKYTIPVALTLFTNEVGTDWHLVMAAATLVTFPLLVIFFIFQKKIIASLAMSGIK